MQSKKEHIIEEEWECENERHKMTLQPFKVPFPSSALSSSLLGPRVCECKKRKVEVSLPDCQFRPRLNELWHKKHNSKKGKEKQSRQWFEFPRLDVLQQKACNIFTSTSKSKFSTLLSVMCARCSRKEKRERDEPSRTPSSHIGRVVTCTTTQHK